MKKLLYGIIILFGVFTFFGVNNFSFAGLCDATNSSRDSEKRTGHVFTCEKNATTNTVCIDTGHKQSCYAPLSGDKCKNPFACCICTKPETQSPTTPTTTCDSDQDCNNNEQVTLGDLCGDNQCDEKTQTCDKMTKKCVCDPSKTCCGIKLNTNVPFIGNCIELSSQNPKSNINESTAFPILMGGLTKILITVILVVSFGMIIAGGVMMTTGGIAQENVSKGKKMIMGVITAIAILGAIGVILRLINPNFFG